LIPQQFLTQHQSQYYAWLLTRRAAGDTVESLASKGDVNTQEVQAKAAAAARWCKHASDHAATVGTKRWRYLLVPHDEIAESKRLADFVRFEVQT